MSCASRTLGSQADRCFRLTLLLLLSSCTDREASPPTAEQESGAPAVRAVIPLVGETTGRAFVSAMRSDLSQVRTGQEIFFVDNDFVYATDIDELVRANLFSRTPGVTVVINRADDSTWDATATHASTDVECDYDAAAGTVECE